MVQAEHTDRLGIFKPLTADVHGLHCLSWVCGWCQTRHQLD